MVLAAAKDSGSLPPEDLGKLKTDRDLTMLAGKLVALGKDKDFQSFLRSPSKKGDSKLPAVEEVPEEAGEELVDEDVDAMLAARA